MRHFLLWIPVLLLAALAPSAAATPDRPAVLILVDGLSWADVEQTPSLNSFFESGAAANVSTAQGAAPADPGFGYVFIGAASRANTAVLPDTLPESRAAVTRAFRGPARTVRPGSFGEVLARADLRAAAIGERAALVVMDREGRVPLLYGAAKPADRLEQAVSEGADLVAVQAAGAREAGELAGEARRLDAVVAMASPNAPEGSPNLTPFALGGQTGLLRSASTRTTGLILNSDIAPTLLAQLGVSPPPEMEGRVAADRPGTVERAERMESRLSFVAERFRVWGAVAGIMAAAGAALALWRGRDGLLTGVLALASLPAAALAIALLPLTSVPAVAAFIAILAWALALAARWVSRTATGALAAVCLLTSALILLDTAMGGPLMKFSTLGYNPGYGARFYGLGNEYAAVLAGALPVGLGALFLGRGRPPVALLLALGAAVVLVIALPGMGADVGGSLAAGCGLGFTIGLLRGGFSWSAARRAALWGAAGLAFAAALFLALGLLFPDASHGARAAGGGLDLLPVIWRKLILGAGHLLNPVWISLLAAGLLVTYAGWRRVRKTALAAGLAGGVISALASGALNDSGIFATLFALAYPCAAALVVLLATSQEPATSLSSPGERGPQTSR